MSAVNRQEPNIWQIKMMQQVRNSLLSLRFDTLRMYDYEPSRSINDSLISDKNGRLVPDENIKRVIELDSQEIRQVTDLLGDPGSYGDDVMRCFIPHLALVYFLDEQVVFHVSICLSCNNLRPGIEIPAHTAGRGMTKKFRTFLNDLLDKYNFSNNVRLDDTLNPL